MSMSDKQWNFLKDVSKLINYADEIGIKLTGGDLFRSEEQQRINLNMGLSKTMDSQHRKRLAIDFNFFVNGELTYSKEKIQILGDYWESLTEGNEWGGNWKFLDVPHFQAS